MNRRNVLLTAGTAAVGLLAVAACGQMAEETTVEPTSPPAVTPEAEAVQPSPTPQLNFSTYGWRTDFSKHSVPLSEISSGGPGKDGIPPIDEPKFITADEAAAYLGDRKPVVAVEVNGEAKAYPIEVLVWHEIVNDTIGGVPVTVTFCPLCNTAIAFRPPT